MKTWDTWRSAVRPNSPTTITDEGRTKQKNKESELRILKMPINNPPKNHWSKQTYSEYSSKRQDGRDQSGLCRGLGNCPFQSEHLAPGYRLWRSKVEMMGKDLGRKRQIKTSGHLRSRRYYSSWSPLSKLPFASGWLNLIVASRRCPCQSHLIYLCVWICAFVILRGLWQCGVGRKCSMTWSWETKRMRHLGEGWDNNVEIQINTLNAKIRSMI